MSTGHIKTVSIISFSSPAIVIMYINNLTTDEKFYNLKLFAIHNTNIHRALFMCSFDTFQCGRHFPSFQRIEIFHHCAVYRFLHFISA